MQVSLSHIKVAPDAYNLDESTTNIRITEAIGKTHLLFSNLMEIGLKSVLHLNGNMAIFFANK